jgi:hypothetical protein
MLITGIDQRIIQQAALAGNDAIVAIALDRTVPLENILRLLPETTTIAVVFGSTPLEKFWLSEMQRDVQRFAERLRFDWYNELSLDAMLKRAAALPPRSAIFYGMLAMDADGVPYQQDRALARLHAVANAPIFSINDSNFGRGIVGGPLISAQELGQRRAEVAVRILGGRRQPASGLRRLDREHRYMIGASCNAGRSAKRASRPAASCGFANRPSGSGIAGSSARFSLPC